MNAPPDRADTTSSSTLGDSQQPHQPSRDTVLFYHVPQRIDVHLDVEYRQRLHALIPAAGLSQLQAVLLRLMAAQAAQQLAQLTSSLFRQYLPFAFTTAPTLSRASSSADALSGLRPALVPFTRDFLREAERGFTETARYAMTEQLDHITDLSQQQATSNGAPPPQHTAAAHQESVSESNRHALAQWLHQIIQQADRAQLLTLTTAFESTTMSVPAPSPPARSTSLPPALSTSQPPATSALNTAKPPLSRPISLFERSSKAAGPSPSQHSVLVSGGLEPLCVILSYLPFSSLCVSSSLVSRRFFAATNDPRCWRLLHSLELFACPPPALLSLLLHKAQRLTRLSFPPLTADTQLSALAASIDEQLPTGLLLAKEPFPLTPYLSRLTTLDLSGCLHITDAAFVELTAATHDDRDNPALPVLHQLQHVTLSGCSALTDVGFSALFAHVPALLSLDLSSTGRVSLPSFVVLTSHCQRLNSLNLSSCRSANDTVVRHVCSSLPQLHSLLLSSCWALTAQSLLHLPATLTELDVSGCSSAVSDRSVRSIALTCHALTALSVRGCALTDAGLDIVLRGCRRLQSFDVGVGREGEGGGGVGSSSLYTDMLLISLSKFARSLHSITLTHCSAITDRGVLTLAQSCPSLAAVNFAHCPLLTNLSLLHIADSPVASALTSVTFSHCHRVDDHGTSYLVNKATALVALRVAQCIAVTDRTLQFLSRRLGASSCAVREVDLFRCPISDRGLIALGSARRAGWSGLSVLLLGNCTQVSDVGVRATAAVCTELKELSLYGCNSITDASLHSLGQYCSRLYALPHTGSKFSTSARD